MEEDIVKCKNCDTTLTGNFCATCGQKKFDAKDKRIGHFVYQFFGSAFFLENNFLKNLWSLITKPGLLATDHRDGRRKRHMTPLSLFFLINLIYFVLNPLTDLNLSLREQRIQPLYGSSAWSMINRRIEERQTTFEAYSEVYSARSTNLTKSLIILHVPMMSLFLMLIYWKKRLYFTDHMVFSLYVISFVLLAGILGLYLMALIQTIPGIDQDLPFTIYGYVLIAALLVYFTLSVRKFYSEKWLWTSLKTPLVIAAFIVSHFIYRGILFLIVFSTT